jgi:hypothetical protein
MRYSGATFRAELSLNLGTAIRTESHLDISELTVSYRTDECKWGRLAKGLCPEKPVEELPGTGTNLREFDVEALIM